MTGFGVRFTRLNVDSWGEPIAPTNAERAQGFVRVIQRAQDGEYRTWYIFDSAANAQQFIGPDNQLGGVVEEIWYL